jgi:chemotaxis receptor (MCP) glutamine deamidase CheD
MKRIFLKPEELCASREPIVISTVLGSCITLCIWDRRLKAGGMNHYVLPAGPLTEVSLHPNRYAVHAIPNLLRLMKGLGSKPSDLVIKMIGGSSVSDADGYGTRVALSNIEAAERVLSEFGLKITERQVGGRPGRKVEFHTDTGEIHCQLIRSAEGSPTLIAIGASTGGTQAIRQILTELPAMMPPIVIVQHIPGVFSRSFAEQLNTVCPLDVKEAEHGDMVVPGSVYIAPGGQQLKVKEEGRGLRIVITDDPPENSFKPSIDYLFRSVSSIRFQHVIALLLTGMGNDGAKGLKRLRDIGAHTIAQDEASCVVFGMPKAAIELNAAAQILPLQGIAAAMVNLASDTSRRPLKRSS